MVDRGVTILQNKQKKTKPLELGGDVTWVRFFSVALK